MHKLLINKPVWRFSLVLTFALFIGANGTGNAFAQSIDSLDRLFTIREVRVDETARQASEARRIALLKAEVEGYEKLLRKITQPEGRERLPELTPEQIQRMVSGIEVVEEQSSSRRYIATLNIRFEPSAFSQFLAQYDVPHVLATGRGVLVLHAHRSGMDEFLWDPSTGMVEARESVDWINRIRQYVFPRGSINERVKLTFGEVKSSALVKARDLTDAYGVRSVLMIASSWNPFEQVLSYRYKSTESALLEPFEAELHAPEGEAQALALMFESVLDTIDSIWRDQLLVDTGTGGSMQALVPTTGLDVLAEVEKRLSEITLVQGFRIEQVGLPLSRVSFQYTGREDQLVLALRYAGLDLGQYGEEKLLQPREPE